jgi:putative hemolysin
VACGKGVYGTTGCTRVEGTSPIVSGTERRTGPHTVDLLIEERAPELLRGRATSWILRRLMFPLLGYREAKAAIDRVQGLSGPAIMDFAAELINMRVRTLGASRLPPEGCVLIVANHPTGLADGVALWRGLTPVRRDLRILANGDVLRISPALADVFVPVEWVKSRRNPAGSRRVLADLGKAVREQSVLVFFPSGRLAHLGWHGLQERPWLPTVVTLARRFSAPIVPLHIRARNSWLFYALSRVSHELRDVTLFHELLNKGDQLFELTLGLPIEATDLPDDPADAIHLLQRHVEVELPRASRSHPRLLRHPGRRVVGAGWAPR